MDNGERLVKVEVVVDEHEERMARIENRLDHIDQSIALLREHTDKGLAELRKHTDQAINAQRDHSDQNVASLRGYTERGFAELRASIEEMRKEQARTTRWLIGILFTYGLTIAGILGRMADLY